MRETMKKPMIILGMLLAIVTGAHAMQSKRSFNFSTYKFNPPAEVIKNLKVGDTFTITDVDPSTKAPRFLKDVAGKDFAENTYSIYPGGLKGPGKGTLTYTVRSVAAQAPVASIRMQPAVGPRVAEKATVLPRISATSSSSIPLLGSRGKIPTYEISATAPRLIGPSALRIKGSPTLLEGATIGRRLLEGTTSRPEISSGIARLTGPTVLRIEGPSQKAQTAQEIAAQFKVLTQAIQSNDMVTIQRILQILPAAESEEGKKAMAFPGLIENFQNALNSASPAVQVTVLKFMLKHDNPNLSHEEIVNSLLEPAVANNDLGAVKWLIERENAKDATGAILEKAINNDFYEAAELLVKHGAKITDKARNEASRILIINSDGSATKDDRYQKLFTGR